MNCTIPVTRLVDEGDHAVDRLGEDALGAVPDVAEVEDVASSPSESMNSSSASLMTPPAIPSVRDLLLDPLADLLEDAVVVERLADQLAARDELDERAQDVRGAAVDRGSC